MVARPRPAPRSAVLAAAALLLAAAPVRAQGTVGTTAVGLDMRVTSPRLGAALSRLLAGSQTADAVIARLTQSGLPVSIGTPDDLADDPGGSGALLPDAAGLASDAGPQLAWVAFRVDVPGDASAGTLGRIERAWVVVDVDRIGQLIRAQGRADAEARIDDDLMVALAHELVAHVGSVAGTRRVEDFCDDPAAGAHPTGELACSLRVENTVRRELNRNLGLTGAHRFPERPSYALDVMNFASTAR